jgi:Lipocalin-like domain
MAPIHMNRPSIYDVTQTARPQLHAVSRKGVLEIAASFGLLAALGNVPAVTKAATNEGVVGAWSLVSFDVDEGQGGERPRFGPDPVGYLIYSADARMAAVLAGSHRPELKSPKGTAESEAQRTESLLNFLAYAGRYEVRGDRVFHHVEVSVFTNLVGTTLERQFKIEGDTLTIRTLPPEIWGSSNVLVWKRG